MTWFQSWKVLEKKYRISPLWTEPQDKRNPPKSEGNSDVEALAWLPAINMGDYSPHKDVSIQQDT